MNIEQRIRMIAASTVRVVITKKTRNRHGFIVTGPGGIASHHPNRGEALSALLAKVRCAGDIAWSIHPVKPRKDKTR